MPEHTTHGPPESALLLILGAIAGVILSSLVAVLIDNVSNIYAGLSRLFTAIPVVRRTAGLRLALGHQARVGKDTFADYVSNKYGFKKVSFASCIHNIADMCQLELGLERRKDRGLLQTIGMSLRRYYGDNVWVNKAMCRASAILVDDPNANIIVTDLRFPNELHALKTAGFTTVKITRRDRTIDCGSNHISETALADTVFDYEITNDGTVAEYRQQIDKLIKILCK